MQTPSQSHLFISQNKICFVFFCLFLIAVAPSLKMYLIVDSSMLVAITAMLIETAINWGGKEKNIFINIHVIKKGLFFKQTLTQKRSFL